MVAVADNSDPAAHAESGAPAPGAVCTLADVARLAGVSTSTVSRVLNGTAGVKADKAELVRAAVAQLNFRLNPLAQGLARGRSMTLGVITQSIESPYYAEAMRGVEDQLDGSGFMPLFVSGHWDEAVEAECLNLLQARRVDGVVVMHARLSDAALQAAARQLPMVVVGRHLRGPQMWSFECDDFEGARAATRHLLQLGHRQIAHIGGPDNHPDALERLRGYQAALTEAGITPDPTWVVPGDLHEQSGLLATYRLLDAGCRFTALFCANDQMAFGARLALDRRGLRVPDDVSLVGFDDLPVSAFMCPPLTTVHQSGRDLGRLAVQALVALLAGETPEGAAPDSTLMLRDSTQRLRR
ncbi:MAG: hypothetical protein RJA98_1933 [Pseudomonadota bacterium]|jgi:LacI family transcriptional regulator